jgi:acetyl-CoA carboxylase biotin carboxylase subunit
VTEWITGVDIVRLQIAIAAGEPLPLRQTDVCWRGAAIECRVNAEDPENNFFPSHGTIANYGEPAGPGVRVDSGVFENWRIPLEYDSLLAKLTVWADSREAAIRRMRRAISEYRVLGLQTNLPLFAAIFQDRQFEEGQLSTNFLEGFFARREHGAPESLRITAAMLAGLKNGSTQPSGPINTPSESSNWRLAALRDSLR